MTRVVGLDLSLTGTGVATIYGTGHVVTETIGSTGHRDDSLVDRSARLGRLTQAILLHMKPDTTLAVIEGPSVMSKGGSNWDRAGLWWLVVRHIHSRGIPLGVAAPTLVKKWATGRGGADKAAVAVAASRMWPEVDAQTDNEWDALCMATIAAQRLGWDVPTLARHAEPLANVAWPVLPDIEGVAA